MTVYSVRLETGSHAASALSDPMSAVNVLLVGQDGRAILHRISALNDPVESQQHVHDICQVRSPLVHLHKPAAAGAHVPIRGHRGRSSLQQPGSRGVVPGYSSAGTYPLPWLKDRKSVV